MIANRKPYVELLKDPRWQRKRLRVFERDGWRCRHCGASDRELQVHHKRYGRGEPWEIDSCHLITLCDPCHERITKLRREANDLLGDMTGDQLHFALTALADMGAGAWKTKPLQFAIEFCEREKAEIIANPYSTDASRRVEALDELLAQLWDAVQAQPDTVATRA